MKYLNLNKKLILFNIILALAIVVIQFLFYYDKNIIIDDLKNTITKLEEKNIIISKELENTQINFNNELSFMEFQREKQKIIEDTFEWMKYQNFYNYKKITLTNASGTTIDITDSYVIKYDFMNNNLPSTFKFEYTKNSMVSKAYTYTFYFEDFKKEITLTNGGYIYDINMCKNIYLYDAAEALLPLQDELNESVYTAKQLLLISKFFSNNNSSIPYEQMRYIILEWMPKNTIKINKLPKSVNKSIITIECFYHGKKAYFKTYAYDTTEDIYTEDYYIELTNDINTEYYKLNNKTDITLWNILGSEIK